MTEEAFNEFKDKTAALLDKLAYSNIWLILKNMNVGDYLKEVDETLGKINMFGLNMKHIINEADLETNPDYEWLYGVKKAFAIRKFLLSDYYNVVTFKNKHFRKVNISSKGNIAFDFFKPCELSQDIIISYYELLSNALDRIKKIEQQKDSLKNNSDKTNLSDFTNIKQLSNIKQGLLNDHVEIRSFIITELNKLSSEIEHDSLSKLEKYLANPIIKNDFKESGKHKE